MRVWGGLVAAALGALLVWPTIVAAQPQPAGPGGGPVLQAPAAVTPSVSVDPNQPGATPQWTITLGARYCGGYRVGDGVYLSPEAPLALPSDLTADSVRFANQPATIDRVNGALRVTPAPGLAQSMICMAGDRALSIDVLPSAGFGLPGNAGDYVVDIWTGANPTPQAVTFTVPATDGSTPQPTGDEAPPADPGSGASY